MRARNFLILPLLLSLFFAGQMHAESLVKGCAPTCAKACCAVKVCCAHSQQPQPAQAPAPQRTNLDLGILGLESFSVLYVRPGVERRLASREPAQAHALPRLAATCIRLI